MKKTTLTFIALLSIIQLTFSQVQQNKDDKKESLKEEFIVPDNKTALNESLEEIKQKIIDAEIKVKTLKRHNQSLESFKSRISAYDPNSVEQIFKDIETAIANKSNEDIYSQEESLINNLNVFSFGFSFRFYDISDDIGTGSTFFKEISDALNPIIRENEFLKQIGNNHDNDNNRTILTNKSKLDKLKTTINAKVVGDLKTKLSSKIDLEITNNKSNLESAENDFKLAKSNKSKLLDKLNEQETQINVLAIKLGLPLFCLTILLLFLGPKILRLFRRADNIETSDETSQNVLLEISTVLLLTMSILILGLSGMINSDVLGTLIGGISGYVLNRIRSTTK